MIQALNAAMEKIPAKEISPTGVQEHPIPYSCRRADALASMAESFLAGSGPSSPASSTADRYQVVVHVDAESLRNHSDGRCELEQGPSIPVETARRLACDASLLSVLENEHGEPLDVGRKTRSIPPAIRHPPCAQNPRRRRHPLAGRAHGLRAGCLGALPAVRAGPAYSPERRL